MSDQESGDGGKGRGCAFSCCIWFNNFVKTKSVKVCICNFVALLNPLSAKLLTDGVSVDIHIVCSAASAGGGTVGHT